MPKLRRAALTFVAELAACRSPQAVIARLEQAVTTLGAPYPQLQPVGAWRLAPQPDGPENYINGRNVFLARGLAQRERFWRSFLAQYRRHGASPMHQLARLAGKPFTFTEAMQLAAPRGKDRWVFDLYATYGYRDGVYCACRPWVVVFVSRQPLRLAREHRIDLWFMALQVADRLDQMRPAKKLKTGPRLTAREIAILRHISEGQLDEEIAERLDIRATSVKTHIVRLRRKLKARNRSHAVAEALRLGVIK